LDSKDGWIVAWQGDNIVAFADMEHVNICYLSEKNERCTISGQEASK
jgi:hypothetical protein